MTICLNTRYRGRARSPAQVDAMVLSGCRICSNLTNEDIQLKGGTPPPVQKN